MLIEKTSFVLLVFKVFVSTKLQLKKAILHGYNCKLFFVLLFKILKKYLISQNINLKTKVS